jgi:NAD-dependent deacetylase
LATSSSSALIQQSAELILKAEHVVVLTGAGISTPSGIPDFRSRDSGLWERVDPFAVASLTSFRYSPEDFFQWVAPLVHRIVEAQPNDAHLALAELEKRGYIQAIITQNIDALHLRAGSQRVFEIHGHLREACCISCFQSYETHDFIQAFLEDGTLPRCPACKGILKPNIVLMGEQLPADIVRASMDALEKTDLILVAGSSLQVTPVATFPITALNRGAQLIIINHEPTYLDERARIIFNEDVAEIIPKIAEVVFRDEKSRTK